MEVRTGLVTNKGGANSFRRGDKRKVNIGPAGEKWKSHRATGAGSVLRRRVERGEKGTEDC